MNTSKADPGLPYQAKDQAEGTCLLASTSLPITVLEVSGTLRACR